MLHHFAGQNNKQNVESIIGPVHGGLLYEKKKNSWEVKWTSCWHPEREMVLLLLETATLWHL